MNLKKYIFVVFPSCFLAGCVAINSSTSTYSRPVEQYIVTCDTIFTPLLPSCLSSASYSGGFEDEEQFYACKQSMANYITALDEYRSCVGDSLKGIFDDLIKDVVNAGNCYINFFNEKKEGDPLSVCSLVELPDFRQKYLAEGIDTSFGVPQCVRKGTGVNYPPQNIYMLEMCLENIDTFKRKSSLTSGVSTISAQVQYDKYMNNLRYVLDEKANQAISKFNCVAEGRDFCP